MIVFEFCTETTVGGVEYERKIYWLGCTDVTEEDRDNYVDIMEQLDAQTTGLA